MAGESDINAQMRQWGWAGLFAGAFALGFSAAAKAQVLSPMEGYVAAQSDVFLAKVDISNPYPTAQISEITLLNHKLELIQPLSMTVRPKVRLGPGEARNISILIPFEPQRRTRIIYVCHAIEPRGLTRAGISTGQQGTNYRGEVCGKVSAFKLS